MSEVVSFETVADQYDAVAMLSPAVRRVERCEGPDGVAPLNQSAGAPVATGNSTNLS